MSEHREIICPWPDALDRANRLLREGAIRVDIEGMGAASLDRYGRVQYESARLRYEVGQGEKGRVQDGA